MCAIAFNSATAADRHDERAEKFLFINQSFLEMRKRQDELRKRIAENEERYGVKSDDLIAALDRGDLEETLEVCEWLIDIATLRRSTT